MARFNVSPAALADLKEIHSCIAEDDLGNADRFADKIFSKFQLLADNPQIGRVWIESEPQLRVFPVKAYLIFYRETNFGIEIFRVIHGAREIDTIFDS